jgi:hypothetical protein
MESGEVKAIESVRVGDRVLAADVYGKTSYSEVRSLRLHGCSVPHFPFYLPSPSLFTPSSPSSFLSSFSLSSPPFLLSSFLPFLFSFIFYSNLPSHFPPHLPFHLLPTLISLSLLPPLSPHFSPSHPPLIPTYRSYSSPTLPTTNKLTS